MSIHRDGPMSIHILYVDPARVYSEIRLAEDRVLYKELTASIVRRGAATAGVNGGFFMVSGKYAGEPDGFFALNGRVLSEPVHTRSAFGICGSGGSQRGLIGRPKWSATVEIKGRTFQVAGINRERRKGEIILYRREFGLQTPRDADARDLIIAGGLVVDSVKGGATRFPEDGYILSGASADWLSATEFLKLGDSVNFQESVMELAQESASFDLAQCSYSSAGPRLVRDGHAVTDFTNESKGFGKRFSEKRHPRTAVGIYPDGRWVFLVVDGRQPKISIGMSLTELADYFVSKLGVRDAYNLDGGGSSTMVVDGVIINSPSDAEGERPVGDAFLFYPIK